MQKNTSYRLSYGERVFTSQDKSSLSADEAIYMVQRAKNIMMTVTKDKLFTEVGRKYGGVAYQLICCPDDKELLHSNVLHTNWLMGDSRSPRRLGEVDPLLLICFVVKDFGKRT